MSCDTISEEDRKFLEVVERGFPRVVYDEIPTRIDVIPGFSVIFVANAYPIKLDACDGIVFVQPHGEWEWSHLYFKVFNNLCTKDDLRYLDLTELVADAVKQYLPKIPQEHQVRDIYMRRETYPVLGSTIYQHDIEFRRLALLNTYGLKSTELSHV